MFVLQHQGWQEKPSALVYIKSVVQQDEAHCTVEVTHNAAEAMRFNTWQEAIDVANKTFEWVGTDFYVAYGGPTEKFPL